MTIVAVKGDHVLAFYRSTPFRWVIALVNAIVGITLALGPSDWHDTASLRFLGRLNVPWWIWGALFVIAACLLIFGGARESDFGYRLGAFLYIVFAVSLIVTIRPDRPANIPGAGALIICAAAHLAAGRLAIFDRELS